MSEAERSALESFERALHRETHNLGVIVVEVEALLWVLREALGKPIALAGAV